MNGSNFEEMTIENVANLPRVEFIEREDAPGKPGVYFFLIEAGGLKIVYVGKAFSLRARLTNHDRRLEIDYLSFLGVPVYVAWMELDPETDDIDTAESQLIGHFQPPLNRYVPSENKSNAISISSEYFKKRLKRAKKQQPLTEEDQVVRQEVVACLEYRVEDLPIRQLRAIAKTLKIKSYSHNDSEWLATAIKATLGDAYKNSRVSCIERIPSGDRPFKTSDGVDDLTRLSVYEKLAYRLEDLKIRELRTVAVGLRVPGYSHCNIEKLIQKIKNSFGSIYQESRFEGVQRAKGSAFGKP